MQQPVPGTARPETGQASIGIGAGEEQLYADGFRQGHIAWRFGARATVCDDLPGWFVADGTQPDLIIRGVNYGKPDLTERVVVGASGNAGFDIGDTGGGETLDIPTETIHYDDAEIRVNPHEQGHGITQAQVDPPDDHTFTDPIYNNHLATVGAIEVLATGGTGNWVIANNSALNAANSVQHSVATSGSVDSHGPTPLSQTGLVLSENDPHSGADIEIDDIDIYSGDEAVVLPLDPYIAVWPLIKVYA